MRNSNVKAELVLASKNASTGDILYTFKLTFPRIILAEVNTHTIATKNTASSRAIPTVKQLKNILTNPFIPSSIGKYKSGMQSGEQIAGWRRYLLKEIWKVSRFLMVIASYLCLKLGAAKQFSNRLVEPWMVVEQIWSSTDVSNEMLLRDHPDAEPHYHELARQKNFIIIQVEDYFRWDSHWPGVSEKCQVLSHGEWHTPFAQWNDFSLIQDAIKKELLFPYPEGWMVKNKFGILIELNFGTRNGFQEIFKALACARCAWISYESPSPDKLNNIISALLTYHKLILSSPKHLSPTQHVATPLPTSVRVGNFCGWFQHRKEIPGESGGDKVVMSITPEMALQLLKNPKDAIPVVING